MKSFSLQIVYLFTHLVATDLIDILLVGCAFFIVLQTLQGTRASQMLRGIIIVAAIGLAMLNLLPLNTFNWLLRSLLLAGAIALPMIFQDELRRALVELGQIGHRKLAIPSAADQLEHALVSATAELAARHEGALIVLENTTPLVEIIETGIAVQADTVTSELLVSLFHPKSPLHDGAVILRGDRLMAASCILPVSTEETGNTHLGTRHRAALGLSLKVPDALIIVVSEERGIISIAHQWNLDQDLSGEQLHQRLANFRDQRSVRKHLNWGWLLGSDLQNTLSNVVISIGLAVIAWVSVIYQTNPPQQTRLSNIPLEISALNEDLVMVSELPADVDVEIQTSRDRLINLDLDSVRAQLKLADLTEGVYRVPIQVSLADSRAELTSITPDSVDVVLENQISQEFTPNIIISDPDTLPVGYTVGELSLSSPTVTILGPQSLVEQVFEAKIDLRLNGRRNSFQQSQPVLLLDEDGQQVEGLKPTPETILVSVPIQQLFSSREIAIQADLLTESIQTGYQLARVRVVPSVITLTGDRQALEDVGEFISTVPINLSDIRGHLSIQITLLLPDGTLALDSNGKSVNTVTAEITVAPTTGYLVLRRQISAINIPPSFVLKEISASWINVLLIGPQPILDQIQAQPELVAVIIDLTALEAGTQMIEIIPQTPEDVQVELFPASVQVVIEEEP